MCIFLKRKIYILDSNLLIHKEIANITIKTLISFKKPGIIEYFSKCHCKYLLKENFI